MVFLLRPLVELCVEPAGLCGRCTGVAPLVIQWPSTPACGFSHKAGRASGLGSPIFPSGCEGKLGVALESLHTAIQAYAPTSNAEEAEVEWFYEDLQDLLELTPEKEVLFIIGDWNAKVGSQEIPGVTGKFGLGGKMK